MTSKASEPPARRLAVLVVSQNYAPEPTGSGKYSGEMAAWLAQRGHHVQVIAAVPHYPRWRVRDDAMGNRYSSRTEASVCVQRAPVWLLRSGRVTTLSRIGLETSFNVLATRWWLPRLVQRGRPDIVVVVCPPTQVVLWPLLFGNLRRVPVLVHYQDLQVDAAVNLGMISSERAKRLLLRAESWLMRRASHVTTISRAMLSRVRAKGVATERSSLFPNWSDLERVQPQQPSQALRHRLGAGRDDVLFTYAGNIGEKQGLEVLLRAAAQLTRHPRVRVAIVGAGANRTRLEDLAGKVGATNVRFHDLFATAELGMLLAAADVHLIIQRREAADIVMPSKLTNILASGRPCIVTADEGTELAHVLHTADSGVLVPPGDSSALAQAMVVLSVDATRRTQLGVRARQYAEQHLDHSAVLTRFEGLLLALAARTKR